MIKLSLAGLTVAVENRYTFIEKIAKDYISDSPYVDFTVSVTDGDIEDERAASSGNFSDDYLESIAAYRKIAERLPSYGAVVFHGAVIAFEGKAYAVTARSGVGKTTHLMLWKRVFGDKVHILNGDKPILRIIDGTVYASGTPWRGKEGFGVNEMLPLRGIGFLERGKINTASSVSSSDALIPLVSQIYIPKDQKTAKLALSVAGGIISSVPLYKLCVNMEPEAAEIAFRAFSADN